MELAKSADFLAILPPAPVGKSGWPWTEASPPAPVFMPNGQPWPRVSVVTPSYNQAAFVEEALRSVLLQGYPNLEYVVMDGGSSDGSVEIIREYIPQLSYWTSQRDGGQAAAINSGFARATGDIVAWLNTDDAYLPGAIQRAVTALATNPQWPVVHGISVYLDTSGSVLRTSENRIVADPDMETLLEQGCPIDQPTVFMRRSALEQAGPLDEKLFYSLDYELWIRLRRLGRFGFLGAQPAAQVRLQADAKTYALPYKMIGEIYHVSQRHGGSGTNPALHTLRVRWGELKRVALEDRLQAFETELSDTNYLSLPSLLRQAARPLIGETYGSMGYAWAHQGHSSQARACFVRAARYQPRLLVNRGVIATMVKSALGSHRP